MIVEAAAAIGAGVAARSLLLMAFGIDSAIELSSALIVFRRLQIEKLTLNLEDASATEHKTARIAGCLLLPLTFQRSIVISAVSARRLRWKFLRVNPNHRNQC